MSLASGSRLGSHEILGLLGAGGMGEVYLAHDTKLNRRVAIKVLPEAYASDPERIARFHREAQAVAALNHGGIAAIYDFAEADGTRFLVLELIEGDTLAERLRGGPLPVEEALQIATQILEALEAAHERGVCHRDLKPANIKLPPGGGVKVLDFGLAKFLQTPTNSASLTHSPTLSLAGTYPGVILGTAGYMSPEQAKGFEADQRSDIFSFGCILYELLTGRQAFEGETASEILASVLKSDVVWSALPARLNPRLIELLKRCLEKNPKKRWHAVADVRVEIESLIGNGLVIDVPARHVAPRRSVWKTALTTALFTIVGSALAAYLAWTMKPASPAPIMRFTIVTPEGQVPTHLGRQALALSPDGTQVVYVADGRFYRRQLAAADIRAIPGSDLPNGVTNPTFSPDGKSIAFRAGDGTLRRMALDGGAASTICPLKEVPYGMSWHDDGIVFATLSGGIFRVTPNGGVPETIAKVTPGEIMDSPRLLPNGRGVMFTVRSQNETWDQARIVVQPLDGTERKTLVTGGADARYLPTGHLAYVVGGVVYAVPIDLGTLSVTGSPVPVVEGVRRSALIAGAATSPGSALFAFADNGTLIYIPGPVAMANISRTDLGIFDRTGGVTPLKLPPGPYRAPRVSPDGQWIAYENNDDKQPFIAVHQIGSASPPSRLTFEGNSRAPLWSPDGEWVVFSSDRDGTQGSQSLFRTRADGSGTAERLTTAEKGIVHAAQSWTRDGAALLFSADPGQLQGSRLMLLSMKERSATPIGKMAARDAVISPDGRWLAYGTFNTTNDGSNPNQVFVEPFPPTGAKYQSPRIGGHPVWSPKGELLINVSPATSALMAVVTTPRFAFGQPIPFPRAGRTEANPLTDRRQVDWLPDGRVIGVMSQANDGVTREISVVINWFEEVRQRVAR
jgi:Tol biopolymer transport system component